MGIDDGLPTRHTNINDRPAGHLVAASYDRTARLEALFIRMDERLARIIDLAEQNLRTIKAIQAAAREPD